MFFYIYLYIYRKILDDLASDGPVKLENFDETGSSNASSPTTEENTLLNSGSMSHVNKEYQSSVLNSGGVSISQVNKEYQSIQVNNVAPSSSGNTVVQLAQGLSENTVSFYHFGC